MSMTFRLLSAFRKSKPTKTTQTENSLLLLSRPSSCHHHQPPHFCHLPNAHPPLMMTMDGFSGAFRWCHWLYVVFNGIQQKFRGTYLFSIFPLFNVFKIQKSYAHCDTRNDIKGSENNVHCTGPSSTTHAPNNPLLWGIRSLGCVLCPHAQVLRQTCTYSGGFLVFAYRRFLAKILKNHIVHIIQQLDFFPQQPWPPPFVS